MFIPLIFVQYSLRKIKKISSSSPQTLYQCLLSHQWMFSHNLNYQNKLLIKLNIMNILPSIKQSRKKYNFSNPLTGVIYNNNHYLQQCHYQVDDCPDPAYIRFPRANNKTHIANLNPRVRDKQRPSEKRKMSGNRISEVKISKSMYDQNASNLSSQYNKPSKNIYKFPDVEVKIIDEIKSQKDFSTKMIRINLTHYFALLFKKTLSGAITTDFIDLVQKYLQILTAKRSIDLPVEMKDHPPDYFTLKSKRAFIERIQQLQSKKHFKPIQELIKFYCVPAKQFRDSCFRDIVHMITQSLYEKFNMPKDRDYVLLDELGNILEDICDIKFGISSLLITTRQQCEKSYSKYRNYIESNLQSFKKITFTEELKKNFRGFISGGKFQQFSEATEREKLEMEQKRKQVQSKLQIYNTEKSPEKFQPLKTSINFKNISKSKSPKRNSSKSPTHRSSASHLEENRAEVFKQKKVRSLSEKKRAEAYKEQYQRMRALNTIHDITFNHNNEDMLLLKVLRKQFSLFTNKSVHQVNAILKAFKIDPQSESINFDDYCRINEVANCKGRNQNIVEFICKYMPFNEYGQMDKMSLAKTLSFILNDINGEEVVLDIIWSWFQKSKLIDNNVLIRNTLESWYQKNKMAFAIMVSLIFGTNEASWLDMAYQIIL